MSDDTAVKKMPTFLKNTLALAAMGLIGFMGKHVWSTIADLEKANDDLRMEVERLKNSQAQWATLAELHHKVQEMEVNNRIMIWLLEHGKIAEVKKLDDKPLAVPKLDPVSPEDYRKIMEQKYPNEPMRKK